MSSCSGFSVWCRVREQPVVAYCGDRKSQSETSGLLNLYGAKPPRAFTRSGFQDLNCILISTTFAHEELNLEDFRVSVPIHPQYCRA